MNGLRTVAATDRLVTGMGAPFSLAVAAASMAASIGVVMQNAASCQQNGQTLARAATASTCARILKAGGS